MHLQAMRRGEEEDVLTLLEDSINTVVVGLTR